MTNNHLQSSINLCAPPCGSGNGGGDWYTDAIWIDGSTETNPVDQDGSMGKPFSTFASAISFAELKQDALPVGTLPGQRAGTRQVFIVAGGIYDEDINILRGDVFYEFLAIGPITLGDAQGSNFSSTNTRNITWLNDQSVEDADTGGPSPRRPQLILGTLVDMGEGISTHTAVAIAWDISGDLILVNPGGAATSTTTELHLRNVRLRGNLDATADSGIRNCYWYRSRFGGTVEGLNVGGLFLQSVEDCQFEELVTCNLYSKVINCVFKGGMSVVSNGSDILPSGFVNTFFQGVFTRLTSADFICDVTTYSWFADTGASLAGGASIVIRDKGVIPLTVGVPVDTPLTGTARFRPSTGDLYIFDGLVWKSVNLI